MQAEWSCDWLKYAKLVLPIILQLNKSIYVHIYYLSCYNTFRYIMQTFMHKILADNSNCLIIDALHYDTVSGKTHQEMSYVSHNYCSVLIMGKGGG